jgi:hypothetical protein
MGFALTVVIACAVFGPRIIEWCAKTIGGSKSLLGETATGLLATIVLIALASLGTEIARTVALPIRFAIGWLLIRLAGNRSNRFADVMKRLGNSPLAIAREIFEANRQFINDYYEGWSRAAVTSPEMYTVVQNEWAAHFETFAGLMKQLGRGPSELWYIALFTSVTQEQALAEYLEATLESLQAAWLTFLVVPVALLHFGAPIHVVIITIICLIMTILLMLPMYLRRKLIFAVFLVYSHMTAFQFGKLADVTDREAES